MRSGSSPPESPPIGLGSRGPVATMEVTCTTSDRCSSAELCTSWQRFRFYSLWPTGVRSGAARQHWRHTPCPWPYLASGLARDGLGIAPSLPWEYRGGFEAVQAAAMVALHKPAL
jgi:hypothetical protein